MVQAPATIVSPETARRVCVAGAGAVGLVAGIALARQGIPTTVIGAPAPARPGRTVALLEGSVRLLDRIGVWDRLADRAAPLVGMRLVDATSSFFKPPPVVFRAQEIGLPQFGFNVENGDLEEGLRRVATATPHLTLVEGRVVGVAPGDRTATVTLDTGAAIEAALVIAADGRESRLRKQAGIGVQSRTWPQAALTMRLTHSGDHRGISTEFHTQEGPFTLVPLPNAPDGGFRSSLVWVMRPETAAKRRQMPPAELASAIEQQAERLLGTIALDGPVGVFPIVTSVSRRLVAPRLALVGEAAHALPPIGAQGMNLSLRDAEALVAIVAEADKADDDFGAQPVLDAFAARRRSDIDLRRLGVDTLNASLLSRHVATDALRGAGLGLLDAIPSLRRWVMRHGLAPERRSA